MLGPHGEQLTEMTNNGNGWQLAHTNVEAGGLSATFDGDLTGQTEGKLYFHLSDWLGTRRQQTDYAGNPLLNFTGLPYGDGLSTIPVSTTDAADATEHHFTGHERDAESGNDYFGARYYSSNMGRFMTPDWSAKVEPVPYADLEDPQSLNLYAYVRNNPLDKTDPDGHCPICAYAGEIAGGAAVGALIGGGVEVVALSRDTPGRDLGQCKGRYGAGSNHRFHCSRHRGGIACVARCCPSRSQYRWWNGRAKDIGGEDDCSGRSRRRGIRCNQPKVG